MSEAQRFRASAWRLALLSAICLAIVLYFVTLTGEDLSLGRPYELQALVPDAVGLAPNADVREAGLNVGKVRTTSTRGANTLVLLQLASKYTPVYRDAKVLMRTKTVVGEPYLEIDPGSPGAGELPSGDLIATTRQTVGIDQALSTFNRRTRGRLRDLLADSGKGLAGYGDELNRLFEATSAFAQEGASPLQVLSGQRGEVATLMDDFGQVMRAIGHRSVSVQLLARQMKGAAEAVASRDRQFGRALEELPGTVHQVRKTSAHLASFSGQATPVLADMRRAFRDLAPAVRELGPAAAAGRRTMYELGRFAPEADPLLTELRSFAGAGTTFVPPLDRFLGQYGPFARYLKPYAPELGAFLGNQRSATSTLVPPSHVVRLQAGVAPSTLAVWTPEMKRAFEALVKDGVLRKLSTTGENPYPRPGSLFNPEPFRGQYPRVTADP